jgi:hypothetical protein
MRHDEIFEQLAPPPGGLAALRARLDARPRRARLLVPLALALTFAAAAVVLLVVGRGRTPDLVAAARQRGDAPEIALGLAPRPASPVAALREDRATTALAEVQTADPRVVFYWVSSTTWKD